MAYLQDLIPGEQDDIWGEIVEGNIEAVNQELIETTTRSQATAAELAAIKAELESGVYGGEGTGGPGSAENYHTSLDAVRNAATPRNWWLSPDGTVPTNYVDGDLIIVAATASSPPSKVTGLTLSGSSATSINATWAAALGADAYEVSYKATADTEWQSAGSTTSLSTALSGLTGGTSYDVRVRGINEAISPGEWSDVKTRSTASVNVYSQTFDAGATPWTARNNTVSPTVVAGGELVFQAIAVGSCAAELPKAENPAVSALTAYKLTFEVAHDHSSSIAFVANWSEFSAPGSSGSYRNTKSSVSQSVGVGTVGEVTLTATTADAIGGIQPYISAQNTPASVPMRVKLVKVERA